MKAAAGYLVAALLGGHLVVLWYAGGAATAVAAAARREARDTERRRLAARLRQAEAARADAPDSLPVLREVIDAQAGVLAQLESDTTSLRGELRALRTSLSGQLEQAVALRTALALTDSARSLAETRTAELERRLSRPSGCRVPVVGVRCSTAAAVGGFVAGVWLGGRK